MSTFFISGFAALIIYCILLFTGVIDNIEEFIFDRILHYEPIENYDDECYNDDNDT